MLNVNHQDKNLRTAADLAASGGGTPAYSASIDCWGAKAVYFTLSATDATTLAAGTTIEVSDDDATWQSATTALGVNVLGAGTNALNAGGGKMILVAAQGSSSAPPLGICWKKARVKIIPNAASTVPGLAITGNRFD